MTLSYLTCSAHIRVLVGVVSTVELAVADVLEGQTLGGVLARERVVGVVYTRVA